MIGQDILPVSVIDELNLEGRNWPCEPLAAPSANPRGGSVAFATTLVGDFFPDFNSLCSCGHRSNSPCSVSFYFPLGESRPDAKGHPTEEILTHKTSLVNNMPLKVLYEDNHIIAVVKPAGVLSQGDSSGEKSIIDDVKKYLKDKYKKPGNVFLGLLHRLDRPVEGIMLFAKTSKGASRLSEQFRNHTIEKTYQAIVIGKPQKERGVLTNKLGKDTKSMKAREFDDGKEAKLFYEMIKSNGNYSLLKIKIDTGKFHQIRSQLSLAGLPILGDIKYGAKEPLPNEVIALCATHISFKAATEEKMVNLAIDLPEEWSSVM